MGIFSPRRTRRIRPVFVNCDIFTLDAFQGECSD